MTKTAETLRAAKARIDTPAKWTQGQFARDSNDRPCSPLNPDATCFCIYGAVSRSVVETRGFSNFDLTIVLKSALPKRVSRADNFNDHPDTSHTDVMAFFDRAIALAEAEGV
jgi:hypothetical protein